MLDPVAKTGTPKIRTFFCDWYVFSSTFSVTGCIYAYPSTPWFCLAWCCRVGEHFFYDVSLIAYARHPRSPVPDDLWAKRFSRPFKRQVGWGPSTSSTLAFQNSTSTRLHFSALIKVVAVATATLIVTPDDTPVITPSIPHFCCRLLFPWVRLSVVDLFFFGSRFLASYYTHFYSLTVLFYDFSAIALLVVVMNM